MTFYDSQSDADLKSGYQQDYQFAIRTAQDLKRMAAETKDQSLIDEVEAGLANWKDLTNMPMMPEQ